MKRSILLGLVAIVVVAIIAVAVGASLLNQNGGATAPGAPTGLTVTVNGTHTTLNWTAPVKTGSGITGYNVYRSNTSGSYGNSPMAYGTNTTRVFTDNVTGTKYYIVKAYNAAGESPASNEVTAVVNVSAAPGTPTGLAVSVDGIEVSLNWTAPSDIGSGVTGYNVYRSNTSGSYGSLPQMTSSGTNIIYSDPQANGTWYFIVKAYNAAGESPASNEVNATVPVILTPVGTLTLQNTAPGNYTITLASISESGIANSSVTILVTPDVGTDHVSQWMGPAQNLSAGSFFTMGWMQPSTSYDVMVRFDPTGGAIATLNISVGADTSIHVGQFVNYTIDLAMTDGSNTTNGTGYYRSEVIAVTSTNVTYNVTLSQTIGGFNTTTSHETTVNLTDVFGGYNLSDVGTNITIIANGTEPVSTPWGIKICDRFDYSMDVVNMTSANGTIWVYQGVLIKNESVMIATGSTVHQMMTLTDTNLPSR